MFLAGVLGGIALGQIFTVHTHWPIFVVALVGCISLLLLHAGDTIIDLGSDDRDEW